MADPSVTRIAPYHYIHVQDNNVNVTRVVLGPQTFTRKDHEKIVSGPDPMIIIPPRHYCVISNPVARDSTGKPVQDPINQFVLRHVDEEIRFEQPPFPLFPGEKLVGKVSPLQVVPANAALRLKSLRDFVDEVEVVEKEKKVKKPVKRIAGDEWLFAGPGTYSPRVEVQISELVKATILKPNQALRLRARKQFTDRFGNKRSAGEEWLIRTVGAFLADVDEELVGVVDAYVLTYSKALHLRATRTFVDVFKKTRKAGEEWLVTVDMAEAHIPDVCETVVGEVKITTLNSRQYCVVLDYWKDGKPQLGSRELRRGDCSFFLNPGERLEAGIQQILVLADDEAVLVKSREVYEKRKPGDKWMIYGPTEFVPPVEIEIVQKRKAIPLDQNEGIYVRNVKTGKVRALMAQTYMLNAEEELWEKELPKEVEELLARDRSEDGTGSSRDKTKVVTFRAPHNSAVQIYDYKAKQSRVVFGPDLVMLGPDEHFTVLSLSGGLPKKADQIKSLCLLLGPDFMYDNVLVETADHARLQLKLSYNWYFDVDTTKPEKCKIFDIPDFVGDSCKAIASRVRAAVASVSFDHFHKLSADVIRDAIFGKQKDSGTARLVFSQNMMIVTTVDIQSVEPVDQRTQDSLLKSVQLAIDITTKSQEAAARHESARLEQGALGALERQKLTDQLGAEQARRTLLELQAQTAAVETTGQATAEAKAKAEAAFIHGEADVKQAQLAAQAANFKGETDLNVLTSNQDADTDFRAKMDALEIDKAKNLADIELNRVKATVSAVGVKVLKGVAEAGPTMQAELLKGLGITNVLISDGNSPVNLFNTANGIATANQ